MDDSNYTKFTRPWYAKRLPFPLNYFVPGRISQQMRQQICERINYSEETDDLLESKVWLGFRVLFLIMIYLCAESVNYYNLIYVDTSFHF